jgi:alpha-tubulin suppressor-like RCC1 family protein
MLHPFATKNQSLTIPTLIDRGEFLSCSSGNFSNFAINANGDAFAWGSNKHGRLGLGEPVNFV